MVLVVATRIGIGMALEDGSSSILNKNDISLWMDNGSDYDATTTTTTTTTLPQQQRQWHLQTKVEECSDALDWFNDRQAGLYRDYFDCGCPENTDGVFRPSESFEFSCSLDNYCFYPSNGTRTTLQEQQEQPEAGEECVGMRTSYRFVLDGEGYIDAVEQANFCVDYQGLGTMCRRSAEACSRILQDTGQAQFSKKRRYEICHNATACSEILPAYTSTAQEICPEATLRGEVCRSNGFELAQGCREALDESSSSESGNTGVGFSPDCGNVEPCAAASCQYVSLDPAVVPERSSLFLGYPDCTRGSPSGASAAGESGGFGGSSFVSGLAIALARLLL